MLYRIFAACLIGLVASPAAILACSCVLPPPPKDALAKALAVFSGKVLAVEREGDQNKVTIEVDTIWKGIKDEKVTVFTHVNGATCGFGFTKDESYLIYCFDDQSKKPQPLRTNICTRTKVLSTAKDEVKELGPGEKPGKK